MRAVLGRWIAGRSAADLAQVGGALGAVSGALAGWLMAHDGTGRLATVATLAGVGGAIGGGVALTLLALARGLGGAAESRQLADGVADELLAELRRQSRARVRHQWRTLLDGRDRLEAGFTGYRRIAPPRSFNGSLRHRADLAAAVDSAADADGGPRLLIVGPAGHGKTVALLDLAQHLADRHGDGVGLPVILNLGSWSQETDDLGEWIVAELCATTGPVPGADRVVRTWLTSGQIAPVLDGLDEITEPASRQRCVLAINDFIDQAPDRTALLVASRPDEYTEITAQGADRLAANAAITLGTLTPGRVVTRLREVDTEASRYLADLVDTSPDHAVADVLCVPLWLWIAGTLDVANARRCRAATSGAEVERVLTDAYLARSIASLGDRVGLDPATCRRLLAAIAGFLADPDSPDSSTFRFENLTPPLPSPALTRAAGVGLAVPIAAGIGLVIGLILGAGIGLLFGLLEAATGIVDLVRRHRERRMDGRPARSRIRWPGIARILETVTHTAQHSLRNAQVLREGGIRVTRWVVAGLVGGTVLWLQRGDPSGFVLGLIAALIGFVSLTLMYFGGFGLVLYAAMVVGVVPGDTIDEGRKASRASVGLIVSISGVLGGVGLGLLGELVDRPVAGLLGGIPVGLLAGVVASRNIGGWYLLMQQQVRRLAREQGLLAADPVGFLLAGVEAGILRRTGGGAQFRHRLLADRLADEAPAPGLMDLRRRFGSD